MLDAQYQSLDVFISASRLQRGVIGLAFLMQIINRIVVNNEPPTPRCKRGAERIVFAILKESQPYFYTCPTFQIVSVVVGMIGKIVVRHG